MQAFRMRNSVRSDNPGESSKPRCVHGGGEQRAQCQAVRRVTPPGEVEGSNWTSILYHWPWTGCFERKAGTPRQQKKKGISQL